MLASLFSHCAASGEPISYMTPPFQGFLAPTNWIGVALSSFICTICSYAILAFSTNSFSLSSSRPLVFAPGALSTQTWWDRASPRAIVVAWAGCRWIPATAAYVVGAIGSGAEGVGAGTGISACAFIAATIISADAVASSAMSVRYCSEDVVSSLNSSAVLVMLTAEPRRLSVVSQRSASMEASCSVVGIKRSVMALVVWVAVFSIFILSRSSAMALRPSTTTFERADV